VHGWFDFQTFVKIGGAAFEQPKIVVADSYVENTGKVTRAHLNRHLEAIQRISHLAVGKRSDSFREPHLSIVYDRQLLL
jgi:hypothetical protein